MSKRRRGKEAEKKRIREAAASRRRGDFIRDAASKSHGVEDVYFTKPIGPSSKDAKYSKLSEADKSVALIERVREAFDVREDAGFYRIHRQPDGKIVREIADFLVNCWPHDWQHPPAVDPAERKFSVLFWGSHTPQAILNTITRASLYADKIYVVNPYTDFLLHDPRQSPLVRSEEWAIQYAILGIFLAMLEPWVKAGFVELVQNPAFFDGKLLRAFAYGINPDIELLKSRRDLGIQFLTDSNADTLLQIPREHREKMLDLMEVPAGMRADVLRKVASKLELDPIRGAGPLPIRSGSQITVQGYGLSYAHARLVCSLHGANLITDKPYFAEVLRSQANEMSSGFQTAAQAFSTAKLSFLNNVPPDFAIGLRQDGSMRDFRAYISSMAKEIDFKSEALPGGAAEFSDRLEHEYHTYTVELRNVQRKLGLFAGAAALGGAATLLTGQMPILGILASTLTAEVLALVSGIIERKKLEQGPLGVLLKLDQQ